MAYAGDAAGRRLIVALVVSCLLHALVLFNPYLGKDVRGQRFSAGKRQSPQVMTATLVSGPGSEKAMASVPAPEAGIAGAESGRDSAQEVMQPAIASRGLGLLPLLGPEYYGTDQLSKRPQPLASVDLEAPEVRTIVASGKIVLALWISDAGEVSDVLVERSDMPEMFARSAVSAFKRLRFTPGERNGRRVGTIMRIEVTYDDGRMPAP